MNLHFRLETTDDHYAVEEMTREAFWELWEPDKAICDEHLLVHRLRNSDNLIPELNIVAQLDDKLVGHIIYTKATIIGDCDNEREVLTFGPLTVSPQVQGMGVGQALMRYSFAEAKRLGYLAVLIFGHPNYYPRIGFRPAAEFGITTEEGSSFDAFMAYPLYEGALDGINGRYIIDDAYMGLTQDDALEFDKKFPPRAPYQTRPISILLDRLDSAARKAMEKTGIESLEMMTEKSAKEVLALPGMDKQGIDAIYRVLKEYGVKW